MISEKLYITCMRTIVKVLDGLTKFKQKNEFFFSFRKGILH